MVINKAMRSTGHWGGILSGLFWRRHHLDHGAAFRGRIIGDRIVLAFANGMDAVTVDALADQVGLDRLGAALEASISARRQFLNFVCSRIDRAGNTSFFIFIPVPIPRRLAGYPSSASPSAETPDRHMASTPGWVCCRRP